MMTMYEKLMMLPVFKGISVETLMSLIEKIQLHFDAYEGGAMMMDAGTPCESLICVLSGEVEVTHSLLYNSIKLRAFYDAGKVLGFDHLFGMNTRYSYSAKAITQCGTMIISKAQYTKMLNESNICLINFLNYLSFRIQRMESAFENYDSFSCTKKIAILLSLFTERNCKECIIEMDDKRYSEIKDELQMLYNKGLIEVDDSRTIVIRNRNNFLDFEEEYVPDEKFPVQTFNALIGE